MSSNDPYKGSNYDDGGMPIGTTYADYDNAEERRKNQVRTRKQEEPVTVFDLDYTEPETEATKEFKRRRPETKAEIDEFNANFNTAVRDQVNVPGLDQVDIVDVEDPAVRRELLVKEADEKGFGETPELPKVEKKETVDEVKKDIEEKEKHDDSFLDEEHATDAKPSDVPAKDKK